MAAFEAGEIEEAPKRKRRSRKGKKSHLDYRNGMYRVLHNIHPGVQISQKAMSVMNDLILSVADKLGEEAKTLLNSSGKKTMTSRTMQTSLRLVFPGELSKHAVSEGTKAITRYLMA